MKIRIIFAVLITIFLSQNDASGCTTFLVSGKYTPDGKPILFKHRDTDVLDNALHCFTDGKYTYIGLINSNTDWNTMVWGGYNSAGFAIINSAAYNNNKGDTTKLSDLEGVIMKLALQNCRNLKDFENLLDTLKKPLGVDANFGVIDAYGGAAYYETGNFRYVKFDANDPKTAPGGFLVRTNHSFSGDPEIGYGYCRYNTAYAVMKEAVSVKKLTPQYLFDNISRNMTHSLTGTDLRDDIPAEKSTQEFRFFTDYIPRSLSSAAVMIIGSPDEKHAKNTVMWTIMGFSLTSVAVPAWITSQKSLPAIVSMKEDLHSPLGDAAMKMREECFPLKRGNGRNYINLSAVINKQETGYLQMLKPVEEGIFSKASVLIAELDKEKASEKDIVLFYDWLDKYMTDNYLKLFNIEIK